MRFKTKKEFIEQYGKNWTQLGATWSKTMECLFGKVITPSMAKKVRALDPDPEATHASITFFFSGDSWAVNRFMFTEGKEDLKDILKDLYKKFGREEVAFVVLTDLRKK